ncbi:MAG: class I SAM-dependent methyltransferase [Chromatiales bacterium]
MSLLFRPTPSPYRPYLPSWQEPLYLHLRPLWIALEAALATCEGRFLDVGCGVQPYRALLGPGVTEYVGVDREGPLSNPTVVGTAESLLFPDGSFDVVLSTQVLEHLPEPERALREAVRVLRRGGRLLLTVPGVWPTHEAPHDYWRFTRHGIKHLMSKQHVTCGDPIALGGLWATVGQMVALDLAGRRPARELVPLVNRICAALDRIATSQDLALCWFVDGIREK